MDTQKKDRAGGRGAPDPARVLRPEEREVPIGAAALAKGLYLLDVIGERETPPRFTDLQLATGLAKGTLSRILNTLVLFRLVRLDTDNNTYVLGHRLFELANRVWESFDLRSASAPVLERLAEETRETVAITAIDQQEILYIDQRSRGGAIGVRVDVGRRAPLHCTAAGKALLASLPPHEQRAMLGRISLDRFTPHTIVDQDALIADFDLIRARGYAISVDEHLEGLSSVAAPVFDHTGNAIAAVAVLGPTSRLSSEQLHSTGRDLMAAARQISGNVGAAPMNINSKANPGPRIDPRVQCVLAAGASLGEGPVWSVAERKLFWVDMLAPSVNRFDPLTGKNDEVKLPRLVSALVPRRSGGWLAITKGGLEQFDFATGNLEKLIDPEAEIPTNRLNDGKCDPRGRLWAGTMQLDARGSAGSLYRIDPDLIWTQADKGFSVANGLDWSPDGKTLYFVDSAPGRIYAYDFELESGGISNRRIFAEIPPQEGRPDGITVDAEGRLWCAVWDGWCVRSYLPNGKIDQSIGLPVPRPSSLAFGGDDLRTLFITTARVRLPAQILAEAPFSGGLFALQLDTPGREPFGFAG